MGDGSLENAITSLVPLRKQNRRHVTGEDLGYTDQLREMVSCVFQSLTWAQHKVLLFVHPMNSILGSVIPLPTQDEPNKHNH